MNNNPIGIFDSGVGGLTVLNQVSAKIPYENFHYYGDNGRAPYGSRDALELLSFNKEIIDFLLTKEIKLIILACNTSCALVLDKIKDLYPIPIIGLIEPATKEASLKTQNKRIAILATEQTVKSSSYKKTLLKNDPTLEVLEIACPELVPIVENHQVQTELGQELALQYFQKALDFEADTIIYGCSHYPYFELVFQKEKSKVINYVDPAKSLAEVISFILLEQGLEANKRNGNTTFWVSGNKNNFRDFLAHYFNTPTPQIFQHSFQTIKTKIYS
ncbi:glutamate racemase [Candidatus Margulisiibacteriota bacterium]